MSLERPVAIITHDFSWDDTSPVNFLSGDWPNRHVLEMQVELENADRGGIKRPLCNPATEDEFWAYHEFVHTTHTFPEDSLPYFDLKELTWFSDCSRVEFSIGAMRPWNITDDVTHTVTFTAARGNLNVSPLGFKIESLVNDCTSALPGVLPDLPDSGRCVSLLSDYTLFGGDEYVANVLPLALEEGLDAPTCFDWVKPANGQHSIGYLAAHISNVGCWPNA